MAGIYLHIPFCKQACFYCDFHFSVNQSLKTEMTKAIEKELNIQQHYLGSEIINTIYFGGGTPSLLTSTQLKGLTTQIFKLHTVSEQAEITLEANPDDLPEKNLQVFKKQGINRLSIGIQSFDQEILTMLNRAHNAQQAETCISAARQMNFNVSIDLIYGIPGRSDAQWKKDLEKALFHMPEHISAYSLTIEPKTVFGRRLAKNNFPTPDEDLGARQFELMLEMLEKEGYEQYEISNFCKPGHRSRHNSAYWKQEKYLGVGPSAHSYNGESRQFNIASNGRYLKAINQGQVPFEIEVLERADKINEYLLTTLRTSWGADLVKLQSDYQFDLLKKHKKYIQMLIQHKKALVTDGHLVLTNNGKLLADKISSDLFIE
nr:radical SAM family heme chaperone HemW [Fulvivirga sp. M361]